MSGYPPTAAEQTSLDRRLGQELTSKWHPVAWLLVGCWLLSWSLVQLFAHLPTEPLD
jgi:hypothetical protein